MENMDCFVALLLAGTRKEWRKHEQGHRRANRAFNRDYVASVQNSDVKRFDEILAPDFYCSNPDKSLVDRAGFLKQTAQPVTIKNRTAHDVKIRLMGDFAIIHAATSYTTRGRQSGARPLHRLLGQAERQMARGIRACVEVRRTVICLA
jgi:hypothetical protein